MEYSCGNEILHIIGPKRSIIIIIIITIYIYIIYMSITVCISIHKETRLGRTSVNVNTFIETYLHPSMLKHMPAAQPLLHTLLPTDSEDEVVEMFQLTESESPFFLLFIVGQTCAPIKAQRMKHVLTRYAAENMEAKNMETSSTAKQSLRRSVVIPMISDYDDDDPIQQLLAVAGVETAPVVSLRIFDTSTGDVYVYRGATDSGFTVGSVKEFCDKTLSGDLAPVDLLGSEFDTGDAVAVETGPSDDELDASYEEVEVDSSGVSTPLSQPTHDRISVLFKHFDEPEPSLPDEVKDLFADESTGAFVIAFVSPAAVQKLLATSDVNSVSDMRSALVANSHFTDLVLKLGQVVSDFSGIRGIVDVQGNLPKYSRNLYLRYTYSLTP